MQAEAQRARKNTAKRYNKHRYCIAKSCRGAAWAATSLQHRKMTDKPIMPQIYIACMLTHCAYARQAHSSMPLVEEQQGTQS